MRWILHISDLHYGMSGGQTRHFFRDAAGKPDPGGLIRFLFDDPACGTAPDAIIASGDIGWSGTQEDYGYAEQFFGELLTRWPVPLVVAPGNHDVDQGAPAGENPQRAFFKMLGRLYGDQLAKLYPVLETADDTFSRERLVAMVPVPPDLFIVAINSAAFLVDKANTPVLVPRQLLNDIEKELARSKIDDGMLRVFVMHHHLLPFFEGAWGDAVDLAQEAVAADPTLVANSAQVQTWLVRNRFGIVLHGHKHMPHVRRDILQRRMDAERSLGLLVIGAGSAGVYDKELAVDERRGYNVIRLSRLAKRRWRVRWSVRELIIADQRTQEQYSGSCEIGLPTPVWPRVFSAEYMDDCHRAIADACEPDRPVMNFLSSVESPDYRHPETAQIAGTQASEHQVKESFRVLHREYDENEGWIDDSRVRDALKRLARTYRFQHGPRLFGMPGHVESQLAGWAGPIQRAVGTINEHPSRAYAGLYSAEIDVLTPAEPIPALVGVQFVPDGDSLDVVATFRNIELSFWWVVNMYEIGKLLAWAVTRDSRRRKARRITFFSPIAIWRKDPEPLFIADVDSLTLSQVAQIVFAALRNERDCCDRLSSMLEQKSEYTNEANLDAAGIERMGELTRAALALEPKPPVWGQDLAKRLQIVGATIREATGAPDKRPALITRLRDQLRQAAQLVAQR